MTIDFKELAERSKLRYEMLRTEICQSLHDPERNPLVLSSRAVRKSFHSWMRPMHGNPECSVAKDFEMIYLSEEEQTFLISDFNQFNNNNEDGTASNSTQQSIHQSKSVNQIGQSQSINQLAAAAAAAALEPSSAVIFEALASASGVQDAVPETHRFHDFINRFHLHHASVGFVDTNAPFCGAGTNEVPAKCSKKKRFMEHIQRDKKQKVADQEVTAYQEFSGTEADDKSLNHQASENATLESASNNVSDLEQHTVNLIEPRCVEQEAVQIADSFETDSEVSFTLGISDPIWIDDDLLFWEDSAKTCSERSVETQDVYDAGSVDACVVIGPALVLETEPAPILSGDDSTKSFIIDNRDDETTKSIIIDNQDNEAIDVGESTLVAETEPAPSLSGDDSTKSIIIDNQDDETIKSFDVGEPALVLETEPAPILSGDGSTKSFIIDNQDNEAVDVGEPALVLESEPTPVLSGDDSTKSFIIDNQDDETTKSIIIDNQDNEAIDVGEPTLVAETEPAPILSDIEPIESIIIDNQDDETIKSFDVGEPALVLETESAPFLSVDDSTMSFVINNQDNETTKSIIIDNQDNEAIDVGDPTLVLETEPAPLWSDIESIETIIIGNQDNEAIDVGESTLVAETGSAPFLSGDDSTMSFIIDNQDDETTKSIIIDNQDNEAIDVGEPALVLETESAPFLSGDESTKSFIIDYQDNETTKSIIIDNQDNEAIDVGEPTLVLETEPAPVLSDTESVESFTVIDIQDEDATKSVDACAAIDISDVYNKVSNDTCVSIRPARLLEIEPAPILSDTESSTSTSSETTEFFSVIDIQDDEATKPMGIWTSFRSPSDLHTEPAPILNDTDSFTSTGSTDFFSLTDIKDDEATKPTGIWAFFKSASDLDAEPAPILSDTESISSTDSVASSEADESLIATYSQVDDTARSSSPLANLKSCLADEEKSPLSHPDQFRPKKNVSIQSGDPDVRPISVYSYMYDEDDSDDENDGYLRPNSRLHNDETRAAAFKSFREENAAHKQAMIEKFAPHFTPGSREDAFYAIECRYHDPMPMSERKEHEFQYLEKLLPVMPYALHEEDAEVYGIHVDVRTAIRYYEGEGISLLELRAMQSKVNNAIIGLCDYEFKRSDVPISRITSEQNGTALEKLINEYSFVGDTIAERIANMETVTKMFQDNVDIGEIEMMGAQMDRATQEMIYRTKCQLQGQNVLEKEGYYIHLPATQPQEFVVEDAQQLDQQVADYEDNMHDAYVASDHVEEYNIQEEYFIQDPVNQDINNENVDIKDREDENIAIKDIEDENIANEHINNENVDIKDIEDENFANEHIDNESVHIKDIDENIANEHINNENVANTTKEHSGDKITSKVEIDEKCTSEGLINKIVCDENVAKEDQRDHRDINEENFNEDVCFSEISDMSSIVEMSDFERKRQQKLADTISQLDRVFCDKATAYRVFYGEKEAQRFLAYEREKEAKRRRKEDRIV